MSQKGFITQTALYDDLPSLKALWKAVFDDTDKEIDRFLKMFFSPELTVVIKADKAPVSAAYILPVGSLELPNCVRENCAMLYAISTMPHFRGRGFGSTVTRAAASLAVEKGYSAVVLKPADFSLFEYYEKRAGFSSFFESAESEYCPDVLPECNRSCSLAQASPAEYRVVRRNILKGIVFIDMDEHALAYQQELCAASGGGMYIISRGNDVGCAAVEVADEEVIVKELLLSGGFALIEAVSAIAARHRAKRYTVRYPAPVCQGTTISPPFGMVFREKNPPDFNLMHYAKWYGLAFD